MLIVLMVLVVLACAIAFCNLMKHDRLSETVLRLETRLNSFNEQFDKLIVRLDERTQQSLHELRQLHTVQQEAQLTQQQLQKNVLENLSDSRLQQQRTFSELKAQIQQDLHLQRQGFDQQQLQGFKVLQEGLQTGITDLRQQIVETLKHNTETLDKRVDRLTQDVNQRLAEISGQVEKRLSEGFEKTNATFTDVVKRLALIDEAQKKITELSTNVVSLQEILADKRSRGAFGEVQLSSLVRNVMPESAFQLQCTLKDGKRADCMLFLPEPTGNMVIDAKFPLESFRRMTDIHAPESDRRTAEKQFRQDIQKHIQDIASKYIVAGETADGAVMFIPAEAIFAEIHARYPELVEASYQARVWMVSPTTMMAILTTSRAVLKDAATRKQVHIIQEHLGYLAKDFKRFQDRMGNLAKHIDQAQADVKDVKTSADKISSRFGKIEKVELPPLAVAELEIDG